jgi:voltage-gated potassium channel
MKPYDRMQKLVYDLLHAHEQHEAPVVDERIERYSHAIRIIIGALILLGIIVMMAQTVDSIDEQYGHILNGIDLFIAVVFSVEYVLRVWSIPQDHKHGHEKYRSPIKGRLRYMYSPMAIVDFLSAFPFFFMPTILSFDTRLIRLLRAIRIFRVLKLERYTTTLSMVKRVAKRKKEEMVVAFTIFIVLLIVASTGMYHLEREYNPKMFSSIPTTMWWGVELLTQNGYGDAIPVTTGGKIFSAIISIFGIGLFAVPTGILIHGLNEEAKKTEKERVYEHLLCDACREKMKDIK